FCFLLLFMSCAGMQKAIAESYTEEEIMKECFRIAVRDERRYYDGIKWLDRDTVDWDSLNEAKRTEYRTRNVCAGDFMHVVMNCVNYKCLRDMNQERLWHLFFLKPGLSAERVCEYMETLDCYNDDITGVQTALAELGGTIYGLFALNMDEVTAGIRSGENPTLTKIETNNEICWLSDGNGDTVWHALAEVKDNSLFSFANMCLSILNEQSKEYLYNAVFYKINNQGKTAVSVALDKENIEHFSVFGWYFKQEGIECDSLIEDSAKELGVDKSKLSVLCPVK
ncbi:MAG: hypothetical protein J6R99_03525, partial [Alphaproteobacteria bacterium]|nr:hypothetical protein [Alphaproteobacteria bacterium]